MTSIGTIAKRTARFISSDSFPFFSRSLHFGHSHPFDSSIFVFALINPAKREAVGASSRAYNKLFVSEKGLE